jgi:hypothetical protein
MTKTTELAALADALGGSFKPFSQSLGGLKGARTGGGYTSDKVNLPGNVDDLYVGGTCQTMSMYWIAGDHFGVGSNRKGFIDWMLPTGVAGPPDMGAVSVVVAKTVMYKASGAKAASQGITKQANFESDFFARYGVRDDKETAFGVAGIRAAISQSRNRYFMVSYNRDGGGHGCASLATEGGSFAYFDPNFGEVRLPAGAYMRAWFDGYMRISEYETRYPTVFSKSFRY